ncbi:tripartite tricarboxylate transporter substrate binding protein [Nesterenkonia sp. E16_7]|uniref:tripartite tricarboxylate transporter substrate binding protein n=1 Tax=unclassified Nesterenkonia TaxID=2629769 RepID=UPI001A922FFC|nr:MULTISPECIES: tripartite tricarboxylate transporter substrate binding protein [unclassified Nesterenkonia]MBO0595502.1 tripartite tricarboxylate transporter substrate binding protein [Nesterenkonia sp. E16_10]MBO0599052.1 tripartite tricarboxylate transporter substrate binding protein [Nesterenkonia sp. E16_7]
MSQQATPDSASPSRRKRILTGGFAVVAVGCVAAASFFSIQAASGGTDVRNNVTLIAPAAAGGGWDTFQRELQQSMQTNDLVNNVQVINVPGAGGTIAIGNVAQLPEANNLMVGGTGQIAAQIQFGTPSRLQDVTPVAKVLEEYDIVVVPADSPHETMDDLVEAWQENPSGTPWTGGGSFDQLVMTEIALVAGISPGETTYIPSDGGGEAIQALLNGTAVAAAGGFADMYPQVESGRLRVLGVAAEDRLAGEDDIPTLAEEGYDVTLTNWRALFAPPSATEEEVTELRELVDEAVATPEWAATVERNYWREAPLQGEELDQYIADETERIGGLFEEMGQ